MQKQIKHVERFHNAFGITNKNEPTATLDAKTIMLRYKLMREENEEYLEAAEQEDMEPQVQPPTTKRGNSAKRPREGGS